MNQKTPDSQNPSQQPDYRLGQLGRLPLFLFDAQGPKSEQQDNVIAFTLKEPMTEARMRRLFEAMVKATNAPELDRVMGGSTVNLVAISKNRIIAGNLGDSLTTLFTRKAVGEGLEATKLSSLHVPGIEGERERLAPLSDPFDVYTDQQRIWKNDGDRSPSLAMSRALGDSIFAPLVVQEPDIHTLDIDSDGLDYAQIAAYTDGLTDTRDLILYDLKFHAEFLGAILDQVMAQEGNQALPLAAGLAYQALDSGLMDNAAAMSVDLKALGPDTHILIGVFDGHAPEGRKMTELAIQALQNLPELG